MFSGLFFLLLSLYFLVPSSFGVFADFAKQGVNSEGISWELLGSIANTSLALFFSLFTLEHFLSPTFWLFLLIAFSISTHTSLSLSDMKGALDGLLALLFLLIVINSISLIFAFGGTRFLSALHVYHTYLLSFFLISLFFSLLSLVISFVIYAGKKQIGGA
jgi:hypothetical protein